MPFDTAGFERKVLAFIRMHRLVRPGDRAAVAVSGGADSVALLRLMLDLRAELGIVLSIVHFNHKIRGEASDADEGFVRELADRFGLELHASCGDTPAHARKNKLSLETAGRDLRYLFFRELIVSGAVSKLMTAHTLDDQAETVLLRIIRGTGTAGLASIYPRLQVFASRQEGCGDSTVLPPNLSGEIIRPLLAVHRCEIEDYLHALAQPWREDATNADPHYLRNRVRHVLLPLIQREFNPSVRERLAELAEIARAEEEQWRTWLSAFPPKLAGGTASLDVSEFSTLGLALQRLMVRQLLDSVGLKLDFDTTETIRHLAAEDTGTIELPNGWRTTCLYERRPSGGKRGKLLIVERAHRSTKISHYQYTLTVPGEVAIAELRAVVRARLLQRAAGVAAENGSGTPADSGYNPSQLLDTQTLLSELTVRDWRPGDRFWPAHTSGPRKVKELLQQRHVTGTERALWPVVLSGNEIVWMRGFPVSEKHRATSNLGALLLIDVRLPDDSDSGA